MGSIVSCFLKQFPWVCKSQRIIDLRNLCIEDASANAKHLNPYLISLFTTNPSAMHSSTTTSILSSPTFPCRNIFPGLPVRTLSSQLNNNTLIVCLSHNQLQCRNNSTQQNFLQEDLRRRQLLLFSVSSGFLANFSFSAFGKTKSKSPYDERRLLEQNKKIQEANNAPTDFPNFVREGFEVKVVTSDSYIKRDSGLIYLDIKVGEGDCPKDGQQVTFHYIGFNESGRRIDSSYLQGAPAKIRMGTSALVPGFEEGIRDMRPGGKRRLIIPPELGPPVGPSTFFSSKQFEVFDVELLEIQNCQRRTIAFYSDVVCS